MRHRSIALALASAVFVSLGSAAWAAGPYQVTVGGSSSGDHYITATSVSSVDFVSERQDPSGAFQVPMACGSVTAEGWVYAGSSTLGVGIGTIEPVYGTSGTTWNNCVMPFGLAITIEQTGDWSLDATGTATTGTSDVVAVSIGNVRAHVYATSAPSQCSFDVTGSMDGTFDEATQRLSIAMSGFTGDLTLSGITVGVNDCFGMRENGDPLDITGDLALTSPDGPVYLS